MVGTTYCQLCRIDASASHDDSARHRAARQLAAVAIERLSNHVSDEECIEGDLKTTAETDDILVSFCGCCNITVPHSEFTSHLRQKNHTLALLTELTLAELVQNYVGQEKAKLVIKVTTETHNVTAVDQFKAVNTYTCHFCALSVPLVFKTEHERGSRHISSRALAITVANRVRDMLAPAKSGDTPEDISEDKSGDKSKDSPEDKLKERADTEDRPRFSGKMMKKLFKTYTGRDMAEVLEDTEEPEPRKPAKRLTAKDYFRDILPYLSYVGSFYTLIIDDTEFVTIKIGRDTLKIHVNNLNGLYNYGTDDSYYMNCRLCDGFENKGYSSVAEQDKLHVLSLGHVKNVLTPFDNLHLVRKIDESHSSCALCNVNIYSHLIENHILKDLHHTSALKEALERGKHFKDSNEHLKIMIYSPNQFLNPKQISTGFHWPPANQNRGVLFGNAQNNSAFAKAQNNNVFGNAQNNSAFGNAQNNSAFGNAQNNSAFGNAQNNNVFGNAQNSAFGNAQNNSAFGNAQNSSAIGHAQNNSAFTQNNPAFDSAKGTAFGGQNTGGVAFGSGNSVFGAQNNTVGFGTAQSVGSFGNAQSTAGYGTAQANITSVGNASNPTGFGAQNTATGFGAAPNNAASFGSAQQVAGFGAQNKVTGATLAGFGAQNKAGNAQTTASCGSTQNPSCFGCHSQPKQTAIQNIKQGVPIFINRMPLHHANISAFGNTLNTIAGAQSSNGSGCVDQAGFGNAQPGLFNKAQRNTALKGQALTSNETRNCVFHVAQCNTQPDFNASSQINQTILQTKPQPSEAATRQTADSNIPLNDGKVVTQNTAQQDGKAHTKSCASDKKRKPTKTAVSCPHSVRLAVSSSSSESE